MLALDMGLDQESVVDAGHGLLEVEFHHVADVGPATRSARSTAAEDVAEDIAEDVAHVGVAGTGVAAAHAVLARGVAVLVVHAALAAVRQHLVRLLALLERLDRAGVRSDAHTSELQS